RIASRYAKSLIDLAQEQDKLDRVLEDINSFEGAIKSRDLYLLMKSPIINGGKKLQIFNTIFEGKFDEMTLGFFRIVINKGREALLPEIAKEFVDQYKVIKHISTVKLTTAVPLGADALAKIKEKLLSSSATDDQVEIETKVDPNILGGFVIEFDDQLYNASVVHQMEKLKKEFSSNLYVKDF
ncbi:MAG: ATP synthase F1 subunit delta, partial [Bacteroidota bacterium]